MRVRSRASQTHLSSTKFSSTKHRTWIVVIVGFIKSTIALFLQLLTIGSLEFFHAFLFGSVLMLLCGATIVIVIVIVIIVIIVTIIDMSTMDLLAMLLFRFSIRCDFQSSLVRSMQEKYCYKCDRHQSEKRQE